METTTTSIFYNFEYSTYVMFHFLTHLTPSMYEDHYVKMKIAYRARNCWFLHTLKIYTLLPIMLQALESVSYLLV